MLTDSSLTKYVDPEISFSEASYIPEEMRSLKRDFVADSKGNAKMREIAAGEFDLYAAEPRACEWDIAAGHAILEHAGGKVTDFDGNTILYGKPDFKNPSIILKNKNII